MKNTSPLNPSPEDAEAAGKHTPTPWLITTGEDEYIRAGNELVARCYRKDGNGNHMPGEDNAAFIVRACNNFDALVAQVRELREALNNLLVMLPSDDESCYGKDRIPPGFCYVRWKDIREGRKALAANAVSAKGEKRAHAAQSQASPMGEATREALRAGAESLRKLLESFPPGFAGSARLRDQAALLSQLAERESRKEINSNASK